MRQKYFINKFLQEPGGEWFHPVFLLLETTAGICCQLTADCGQMTANDNVLSGERIKTEHFEDFCSDIRWTSVRTFVMGGYWIKNADKLAEAAGG